MISDNFDVVTQDININVFIYVLWKFHKYELWNIYCSTFYIT